MAVEVEGCYIYIYVHTYLRGICMLKRWIRKREVGSGKRGKMERSDGLEREEDLKSGELEMGMGMGMQ